MGIEKVIEARKRSIDREMLGIVPRKYSNSFLHSLLGKPSYEYSPEALTHSISVPIWDFLSRGGKRWRPVLFLLVYEALGGRPKGVLRHAAIPELIHNGTIIVDDIEDDSFLRRGKPCLHRIYGIDVSVNAGNFLYFAPLLQLGLSRLPPLRANRVYRAYVEEMVKLSLGQATDIAWHRGLVRKVTERQYLQMCSFKTGTLARLAARLAAILAGASEEKERALGKFAESIGVAFQIQDDILNLRPTDLWGKSYGDDITEGKRTLIVIHCFRKSGKKERSRLMKILGMHTKDRRKIAEAVEILDKYGSLDYAKEYAREMVRASWKGVDRALRPSKAKGQLKAFADYLVERRI